MDIFSQKYCRFCMKDSSRRIKLTKIDKQTEESFNDFTNIKLSSHSIFSNLSSSTCDQCLKDLDKCLKVKKLFIEKQSELEKLAIGFNKVDVKTEAPQPSEIISSPNIKVEIEEESKDDDNFDYTDSFTQQFMDYDSPEEEPKLKEEIPEPEQKKGRKIVRKQCTECGSVVKNLSEHMKYTHNQVEKKFFCDQCEFSCYFKQKMEIHTKKHIPREFRNMLACPHCVFRCDRKDTLKKHILALHQDNREKKFACEECDKMYYSPSQLNTHVKQYHRNIRNFQCPHCEKKFYTIKDLNLHTPRHFDKKEKCPECEMLFFTQHEVKSHMKRIHLPPTIKCPDCDRMFVTNEKLKEHKRIRHDRTKDFVCVECGAAFAQYNTLKRHIDTVHRSLRVTCPFENCGFSMKRKERFKRHLVKYHPQLDDEAMDEIIKNLKYETEEEQKHVKEFKCPDCEKIFTKYHNLKNHIKKGHAKKVYPPKVIICPIDDCAYQVARKYRLRKHLLKVHQHLDEEAIESVLKSTKSVIVDG